jgi:recombination protein RecA
MPKKNKKNNGLDDFTSDLIKSLNKEFGSRVAYNLGTDIAPTHVKRWISTGSKLIDYIVANRCDGGLPEGRIVEIFGPPSIGKSHLAIQVARATQQMGGMAVYIDTENATSVENLETLGVDITKHFVFIETSCTEDVFKFTESTILKAKAMHKDVPITIIWDSVAASSPKAELLGDYDKDSIGLQARAISKGMRKITQIIGDTNTLFLILNQTRTKIGVMFGDPDTTPGGKAIPFHSSVRLKLGAGQHIKNKDGDVIGINVWAKTIKNKVAPPFRKVEFEIHFGVGIKEHEQIFDLLRKHGEVLIDDKVICVSGATAWKNFSVTDSKTGEVLIDKKFHKSEFDKIMLVPEYESYINDLIENVMIKRYNLKLDIDPESYEDIRSLNDLSDTTEING